MSVKNNDYCNKKRAFKTLKIEKKLFRSTNVKNNFQALNNNFCVENRAFKAQKQLYGQQQKFLRVEIIYFGLRMSFSSSKNKFSDITNNFRSKKEIWKNSFYV